MAILKKLNLYWGKANPPIKEKLQVYDAIIGSDLLYGLESAPMNDYTKHELDIFQLKGIRKIFGIKTTFIDRTQDTKTYTNTCEKDIKIYKGLVHAHNVIMAHMGTHPSRPAPLEANVNPFR